MLWCFVVFLFFFFFKAEDGIRYFGVTRVQTCALPICEPLPSAADERNVGVHVAAEELEQDEIFPARVDDRMGLGCEIVSDQDLVGGRVLAPDRLAGDLSGAPPGQDGVDALLDRGVCHSGPDRQLLAAELGRVVVDPDRKSTRLNSSHANISYA